jgi:hypothetical protein
MNFGYRSSFQSLDKGIIERAGATGFTASIFSVGSNLFNFHSGIWYHTAYTFIAFAIAFFTFFTINFLGLGTVYSFSFFLLILGYVSFFFAWSKA